MRSEELHGKFLDISFGAWAIGGSWGNVSDEESIAALHKAVDSGVNVIDTADVYGAGGFPNKLLKDIAR